MAVVEVALPLPPPPESESESESELLPPLLLLLPSPFFIVATSAFCCFRLMREVSMIRRGAGEEAGDEAFLLPSFLFEAAATTTRGVDDLGVVAARGGARRAARGALVEHSSCGVISNSLIRLYARGKTMSLLRETRWGRS